MEKSNTVISIQNIVTRLEEDQTRLQQALDNYNIQIENITQVLKKIVIPDKTLTLESINEEILEDLIKKYNIPDEEYVKSLSSLKLDNFKKFFPDNYKIELEKIQRVLKVINSIIVKLKEEKENLNKKLESIQQERNNITRNLENNNIKLNFYTKILEYLTLTTIDTKKIEEIKTFILTTNLLTDEGKAKTIQEICKNIIANLKNKTTKENTSLTVFEEALENLEEKVAEPNKTTHITPKELPKEITEVIEEIEKYKTTHEFYEESIFTLEDIQTALKNDQDKECINFLISACIIKMYELIENQEYQEELKKYIECFHKLKEKEVQQEQRLIELTNMKETLEQKQFRNFYYTIYHKLDNEDDKESGQKIYEDISNFLEKIDAKKENGAITEEEYENFLKSYNNIVQRINAFYEKVDPQNAASAKNGFKGFIIAEIFNNETVIESDLINKPLIDKAISSNDWKKEYSQLVDDLVYKSIPTALFSSESNVGNNADKLDRAVYFEKGNETKENMTGMHRYRPTRNSNVRFVERKITLHPGTTIFTQVTNIILKYFPNAKISNIEDFTLFINFANGLKVDDTEIYTKSINRLKKSTLMEIFHENGKYRKSKNEPLGTLKVSLNDDELKILEEYIKNTIESFQRLNNEEGFNITFLNSEPKKERRK